MDIKRLEDEHKILFLLSEGSEYAFTQVFDRYKSKIYSIAINFLKSPLIAEEVVQDVFLKIWINRKTLAAINNFDNYLFIICRNHVFDRLKKQSYDAAALNRMPLTETSVNNADHKLRQRDFQALLDEAIAHLPPQQQQVYKLSRIEGIPQKEIAERLQISSLTVKKHMSLAIQSIRKTLEEHITVVAYLSLLIRLL